MHDKWRNSKPKHGKNQSLDINDSDDVSGRDPPASEGPRTRSSTRQKPLAPDVEEDAGGTASTDTIFFYESNKPHYGFTNFSPHTVTMDGKEYPTSEHLFQAMKVCKVSCSLRCCCDSHIDLADSQFLKDKPLLAEHIRVAGPQPRMAFDQAHRFANEARKDWFDVRVEKMKEVIKLKFEQHSDLKDELLATGEATLVEDARGNDAFWGNGADGKGRNELGKALMGLRTELRSGASRL
ncbi:hypothetical protein FRB94_014634 [Tulasnella sp. JGI-2019a]|nr:hypothetical protein FRB94_014634 [Tulasnella sp. JGI-2019a]